MTWAKVSDDLHSHPKVLEAGLEAMGLWVLAMSYEADYLLDGKQLTKQVLGRLSGSVEHGEQLAGRLVAAGLWDKLGPNEWAFHDWHDYQPTRDAVLAEKQRKAEAGRKGGQARAKAQAKADAQARALALGKHAGSESAQPPSPSPSPSPSPIQIRKKSSRKRDQPALIDIEESETTKGDHQRVIDAYVSSFERARGEKPVIDGRTAKAAKKLREEYGVDLAVTIIANALANEWQAREKPLLWEIEPLAAKYTTAAPTTNGRARLNAQPWTPGERLWSAGTGTEDT